MGRSYEQFLIDAAQGKDAQASLVRDKYRDKYSEYRKEAFKLREQARSADSDKFEKLTDSSIESAIAVLEILCQSERLTKEQSARLGRARNLIGNVK